MAKKQVKKGKPVRAMRRKQAASKPRRTERRDAPKATRGAPKAAVKPAKETSAVRAERAGRILQGLRETYPEATCALHHRSAYELLVATILSAQCTDVRVNMVTPDFFRRYPDAAALADAARDDVEAMIKSTGFFRNKAKSLLGAGRMMRERFGGRVPETMNELLELPGVARKTANCVLGTWFGQNEGIVVDTHVGRLALRLGLLTSAKNDKDAVKIEQDLMPLFPRGDWSYLSHALIEHGRRICAARSPKCGACPLAKDCPSAGAFAEL